jgi:hypothetical protein
MTNMTYRSLYNITNIGLKGISFFIKPWLKPSFLALAFCALLPSAVLAQIGGTGWSSQSISYNVQWPTNAQEDQRFWHTNNIYHCLTYSNDGAFSIGNTTLPRTEMRFNPDFTSGEIQYQSTLQCPANENSYCIMQDHTGDSQSDEYGPVAIMFIWQSRDGGSVWNGYTGQELATEMGGKWFQLNVDHNVSTHMITAWINGTVVVAEPDNGATDYYFKNGVYEQNISTPSHQMDTYVTNILEWTTTSSPSFSGTWELKNAASGLVLNNQGSLTNGSIISQWKEEANANLEWTFKATSNGYYQINSVKSGLDAVVQSASTANGAGIIQWSFGSSGNDQWLPVENSNGTYTFFNLNSGKVLEDPNSSTNTATQMDQWTINGGANQQWYLISE